MNILLTMNLPYTRVHGGANKSNKCLAEEFVSKGHNVWVITPALAVPSDITLNEFVKNLSSEGVDVIDKEDSYIFCINGVQINAVKDAQYIRSVLLKEIKKLEPDWILISSEDPSQTIFNSVHEVSPDNIIYLAHTPQMLPFGNQSLYPGKRRTEVIGRSKIIVTISEFVANYIQQWSGFKTLVNHPPHYGKGNFKNLGSIHNQYVLMINPCSVKGIIIFKSLVKIFANVKFAAIAGWGTTLSDMNDLKQFQNVTFLKSTSDLDGLFKQVKVLLMPSLCEEGFGMTVIDAMARGIPVISSDRGGLKEAKLGTNYIIPVHPIQKFSEKLDENSFPIAEILEQDIDLWKDALNELINDNDIYEHESKISHERALRFISKLSIRPLEEYMLKNLQKNKKTSIKNKLNDLSDDQKRKLIERVKEKRKTQFLNEEHKLKAIEKREYYDVTYSQKQWLMVNELNLGSYNGILLFVSNIEGKINIKNLKKTFKILINHHESLRTRFVKVFSSYKQFIFNEIDFKIEEIDIHTKENKVQLIQESIEKISTTPFNLYNDTLFRLTLLRYEENKYMFLLSIHHIICDGWSIDLLREEVFKIYSSLESGNSYFIKPLFIQNKDYASWENLALNNNIFKGSQDYWHNKLAGEIPILNLSTDKIRPKIKTYEGSIVNLTLSPEKTESLLKICKSNNCSLFILLATIVKILLCKYTEQNDIIVGIATSGRRNKILENQLSCYINMLALRDNINDQDSFKEILEKVKNTIIEAQEHEIYPYDKLVDEIVLDRDLSRSPFFDVIILNNNKNTLSLSSDSNKKEQTLYSDLIQQTEKYVGSTHDLCFSFTKYIDKLDISIIYNFNLFTSERIHRLTDHVNQIVSEVITNQNMKLQEFEILTDKEKKELLMDFNHTVTNYSKDKSIIHLFEEQVGKTPNNTAIVYKDCKITYKELSITSSLLAKHLVNKGVKRENIIGIMTERSLEMIIGIFGILKASGAYMPISPEFPEDRIHFMIEDSEARFVLCENGNNRQFNANCELIYLDDILQFHDEIIVDQVNSKSLAYIIYTSGTTGKPKGVMIEHHSLVNRLEWMQKSYPLTSNDTLLQKTPFTFDVSVWEIFWWSMVGAKLIILKPEGEKDPKEIIKNLERNEVNVIHFVPSMLKAFLDYLLTYNSLQNLRSLKRVICSGEALTKDIVVQFQKQIGNVNYTKISNLYGPTEATIDVTYYDCPINVEFTNVSIGKPIDNTQIYILSKNLELIPKGVFGELYIGGVNLARGYLKREELTKEKFINNPFIKGEKIYRTGDIARWLEDGNIEFIGRKDNQVKIRGNRIELGEIEYNLKLHPSIRDAIVLLIEKNDESRICAFLLKESSDLDISLSKIKEFLLEKVPSYMIPASFNFIEQIPLTYNGKINHNELVKLANKQVVDSIIKIASTQTEKKLLNVWKEVLKRENIGIDQNFFEIGGHSLRAIEIISIIHLKFDVELSLAVFFEYSTIQELACIIEKSVKNNFTSIQIVEKKEYYTLSQNQMRIFIAQQINLGSVAYNMPSITRFEKEFNKSKLISAFTCLLNKHESLKTYFKIVNGIPVQFIQPEIVFEIEEYKIAESSLIKTYEDLINPFDLSKAPLMRVSIIKTNKDNVYLFVDMHHIISDGISHDILKNHLFKLYDDAYLPPLKVQYKDYSEWKKQQVQKGQYNRIEDYWEKILTNNLPILKLPYDYDKPALRNYKGESILFSIDNNLSDLIRNFAIKNGGTTNLLVFAIFNIFIAKICRQNDIVLGMAVDGRNHYDLKQIVGMFVNIIPLRNYPTDEKNFLDFYDELLTNSFNAFNNQEVQIDTLMNKLSKERKGTNNPLNDVVYNYQILDYEINKSINENHEIFRKSYTKFDLTFTVLEYQDTFYFNISYSDELFERETIRWFVKCFKSIINQIFISAKTKIGDIKPIIEEDTKELSNYLTEKNSPTSEQTEELTAFFDF